MPPINVLIKPSSGMCNMQCDYCFYCDETQKRIQESYGFMSEDTLKNVIRKTLLHAEGMACYAYQGGEPTLRGVDFFKKAVELQKKYNKHRVPVQNAFQTNGYLMNEEWCRFFKENHFLVGISLDGIAETHDRYRHDKGGRPVFQRIQNAIRLLEQFDVDFNILTVVNQGVAEEIDRIYAFYKENGWKYQQYIACLDPLDEVRGKKRYSLAPNQYGEFLVRLFELWYEDWKEGKQPYIRQFDNYIGILMGYLPEACDQRGICGIQNVVEADGSVYPCDFYMLDKYRLGNFNIDRLTEIDKRRKAIGFVERSMLQPKECVACSYYRLCRGGCQRHRDYDTQSETYHNYFCESYRMFFRQCGKKLKEVAEKMQSM